MNGAGARLGYVHIPKTAGTSVVAALKSMFGASAVFHAGKAAETAYFRNNADDLEAYPVLSGHIPYSEFKKRTPERICFTTIREPVERAYSVYKHYATDRNHPLYKQNEGLTFLQHLEWLAEDATRVKLISQSFFLEGFDDSLRIHTVSSISDMLSEMAALAGVRAVKAPARNVRAEIGGRSAADAHMVRRVYADDFALWERFGTGAAR